MRNTFQTKTISSKKLPNSIKKPHTTRSQILKYIFDNPMDIYRTQICLSTLFFTDPFSSTAKDDNLFKTDQEGRKASSCTQPCDLDALGKSRKCMNCNF